MKILILFIIFSDNYNTLLTFEQVTDKQKFANYVCATTKTNDDTIYKAYYYHGYTPEEENAPSGLDRYEKCIEAGNISNDESTTEEQILEQLRTSGANAQVLSISKTESTIVPNSKQYRYKHDYFVGDYVTVQNERFGLLQSKIRLIGMVECFDQNGYSLTPTFQGG